MSNDEFAGLTKLLNTEVEKSIKVDTKEPIPLKPQPPVDAQLAQMERITHAIRNRIRNERLTLMAEFDRTSAEIRSACERKISDATARLEEERDTALRNLHDETARRLHELGELNKRIE